MAGGERVSVSSLHAKLNGTASRLRRNERLVEEVWPELVAIVSPVCGSELIQKLHDGGLDGDTKIDALLTIVRAHFETSDVTILRAIINCLKQHDNSLGKSLEQLWHAELSVIDAVIVDDDRQSEVESVSSSRHASQQPSPRGRAHSRSTESQELETELQSLMGAIEENSCLLKEATRHCDPSQLATHDDVQSDRLPGTSSCDDLLAELDSLYSDLTDQTQHLSDI